MTDPINRYLSAFLDLGITVNVIMAPASFLLYEYAPQFFRQGFWYIAIFAWTIVYMKDVWNGSSIFKKLFGLKIVDFKTNETALPYKSVVRNTTLLLFLPIEMLWLFVNPSRKLGDLLAGTKVVETEKLSFRKSFKNLSAAKNTHNIWLLGAATLIIVTIEMWLYMSFILSFHL
ncbi:RDD family protein [Marinifilum caeruleilacunae]|uniref:RDD domain-containing protein n=1 Tax=Marinifilum caeruleilacunae TaxID=2499076 RepID=A0ABX1X0S4_9BACT|nr:RDD family protein [Marinifilum caeruleilacunae]NOU62008.1 hypothetical protein [Marinifilum caeruleilacunae]